MPALLTRPTQPDVAAARDASSRTAARLSRRSSRRRASFRSASISASEIAPTRSSIVWAIAVRPPVNSSEMAWRRSSRPPRSVPSEAATRAASEPSRSSSPSTRIARASSRTERNDWALPSKPCSMTAMRPATCSARLRARWSRSSMRLVSLVSAISRSCRVRSSSPLTTVERALSIAWIWRSVLSPIWSAKAPRRSSISDRNWFACSSMPEVMAVRVSRRTLPSAATRSERSAAIEVAVWSKPPLSDEIRSSSADSMRSRTSSVIEERICVRSSRADCIASVRLSRPDRNAPRVVSKARSLADSRSANWVPNVPVCSEKRERKRPDSSSRPERKRMPSLWIDWLRRLVRSANKDRLDPLVEPAC